MGFYSLRRHKNLRHDLPLRRIVSVEKLPPKYPDRPDCYIVQETLECGHVYPQYSHQQKAVGSKRRCHYCQQSG